MAIRGGDTAGLRAYNERLVIDAIRRRGALSQAEIARVTGLSGQAASIIVRRLVAAGLVVKGDKVRGKVGQPSTPIRLNPEGAFSLGVKIGRRSLDGVLLNLAGEVVAERRFGYAAPLSALAAERAKESVQDLLSALDPARRDRVIGLGIAMPSQLHAWSEELGLAPGSLEGWRGLDIAAAMSAATGLEVTVHNDATAACAAELILGGGAMAPSTLYLYIGTFIGAGIVIDGKLLLGARANAGAIGSMPTARTGPDGRPEQLIPATSLVRLEEAFAAAGTPLADALAGRTSSAADRLFEGWMEQAIPDIGRALVSALAVYDFEAVLVDGVLPPPWRRRLTDRLEREVERFDLRGLERPRIASGSIGAMARVLGAALLPLNARFSPDPSLLIQASARPEPET